MISTSSFPRGLYVQGRGAGFMLISSDSGSWEAVACLGTVITPAPSNCYIYTPIGDSMWRGNGRYGYA